MKRCATCGRILWPWRWGLAWGQPEARFNGKPVCADDQCMKPAKVVEGGERK